MIPNRIFCCLSLAVTLVLFVGVQSTIAQDAKDTQGAQDKPAMKQKRKQKANALPSQEEQVAIKEFVQEHHPELINLLDRLEVRRPAIYTRAIKNVAKSHKRLMNVKKNNPDRYETALELWKVKSRVHLASARVILKDSPERREDLRKLVEQQIELRLQQLEFDKQKAGQRLQKVNDLIAKFGAEGDTLREAKIEKESKAAINRFRGLNKKSKKNKRQDEKLESGDGSQ